MLKQVSHLMERRCPRLGSSVKFGYCLELSETTLPCFNICDCWWEVFDVVDYLKNRLTNQEFEYLMNSRPIPKISTLLELIEQARKRSLIRECPPAEQPEIH